MRSAWLGAVVGKFDAVAQVAVKAGTRAGVARTGFAVGCVPVYNLNCRDYIRMSAWQLMKTADPRISMLRRFGNWVPLKELMGREKEDCMSVRNTVRS